MKGKKMINVYNNEGIDVSATLPQKWAVCPMCDGSGTQDCWGRGGMTGDEMAEQGPEFFEDYMNGVYSVPCEECKGRTTVSVFDRGLATMDQIALYDKNERELEQYHTELAAEARYFGHF